MKLTEMATRGIMARRNDSRRFLAALLTGTALTLVATPAWAQSNEEAESSSESDTSGDVIVVSGIRASLASAIAEKRESDNIVEVIQAEDIGKLPDQNLAEVLENITGIQITREAGVGSKVQIRGTDENRTEINGVSTVGSGAGRGGISFEDLPAALISSLEVTKVPNASTIEGSVGGTINLRTLRPLELRDRLLSFRVQGEHSDLSDSFQPRISGTVGDNWSTGIGEIGIVLSGSYARSDNSAFRPRADRDAILVPVGSPPPDPGNAASNFQPRGPVGPNSGINGVTPFASLETFPFLRAQFFDQDNDNFEYETMNFVGSLEWKPNDNLKFYFDGIYNDQQRAEQSTRVQISGVSANGVINSSDNTSFETIDLGTLDGPNGPIDLGSVEAVTSGIMIPNVPGGAFGNGLDPNLRTDTNTGSRLTDSQVYRLGSEWESGKLAVRIEGAISTSNTVTPDFSTTLDFINPNDVQPNGGSSGIDNGVPIEFDLTGGTLQFGIAQGLATTPTTAHLLDPANYALRQVNQSLDMAENKEIAGRFDLSYDTTDVIPFFTSIGAGYRYNKTSSLNDENTQNVGLTNNAAFNRPRANLFSDVVIAGPNNFGAADGRRLFFGDFLVIDPARSFSDPAAILASLNAAITANNAATSGTDIALLTTPTQSVSAFFDITEKTHALYGQANFNGEDLGLPVRGNLGLRWVKTDVTSLGNTVIGGVGTPVVQDGSYEFFLPRFSLVIEPVEDVLIRGGVSRDINRPDFDDLSTSVSFGTGANTPVPVGNPDLVPEAVWSFDISGEYYFAPSSFFSLGFFHKSRTNLFSEVRVDPLQTRDANGLAIDITPPCEGGGIFNPIADRNINNVSNPGTGICVPVTTTANGEGTTTQTGMEVAFQYDLSQFEDMLGFASGFGFIGNYTYQKTGGSSQDFASNFRAFGQLRDLDDSLGLVGASDRITLPNLSKHSYNATLYYEKYGLSARARYTWRSSYVSEDSFFFGLPRINGARGQLNASINYDITDNFNIGVEGINLTKADANQFCVNNNALLCFQGLTDRRLNAGVSVKF